ncbi:MAG: hypothetical protein Tsb0034_31090 [Ekhidna sp.]
MYATFWARLLAHNIDLLPILGLFYLSTLLPVENVSMAFLGLIYLIYHIGFELGPWRATPGKRWAKIYVDHENKKNPVLSVIVRNVFKGLSLLLFFGGFVMIIFNDRHKSLHDYIAGTVVLFLED